MQAVKMRLHELLVLVWMIVFSIGDQTGSYSGQLAMHRRFEYKLSFKGPHLVQRDGSIPFWLHGGHAIASDESIRITPSLRSKKGYVWSIEKNTADHWEVEVVFRISGRGRIGADGLAIWYTEEQGTEGPVFGSSDNWKGLGVFFDSFDNDQQHNNPYVMAMVNDGTKSYDHKTDGSSQQLGGCLRDFRNKPFSVRAKIEYYKKALTVFFHNGMSEQSSTGYELCVRAENVELPKEGYFGISAATGGLADDHDVQSFITHTLRPLDDQPPAAQEVPEDERLKFEKEFEDYYEKLQKAKDEYRKEHPDAGGKLDYEFEGQEARELKQIFEGQDVIHKVVRELHRKLDEVIGRQERTLSQLALMGQYPGGQQGQGQAQGQAPGQGQAQLPNVNTIQRHEVDTLLGNHRDFAASIRDIRTLLTNVDSRTKNTNMAGGYDGTQHFNDVKSNINNMHNDMKNLLNKPQGGSTVTCPDPTTVSCVSPAMFLFIVLLQIGFFIGYALYRSSKEASAKKFY